MREIPDFTIRVSVSTRLPMRVPSLIFAVALKGGFTSVPHSTAYPHRSDTSPQTSHPASPAVGQEETVVMVPEKDGAELVPLVGTAAPFAISRPKCRGSLAENLDKKHKR